MLTLLQTLEARSSPFVVVFCQTVKDELLGPDGDGEDRTKLPFKKLLLAGARVTKGRGWAQGPLLNSSLLA